MADFRLNFRPTSTNRPGPISESPGLSTVNLSNTNIVPYRRPLDSVINGISPGTAPPTPIFTDNRFSLTG